jgi:hypothetical protein
VERAGVLSMVVPRRPKYTPQDIHAGTKHEMEHTKDRKVAKEIALSHLKQHYTYYRVLPAAEATMAALENKPPGQPGTRRRRPQQRTDYPPAFGGTPWG